MNNNSKDKYAAIVGGRGNEGWRWGEKLLKPNGWTVHIVDRNDPIEIIAECSLVVFAISWRNIREMEKLVKFLKSGTLVVFAMGRMSKAAFNLGKKDDKTTFLCDLIRERGADIVFVHFMCAARMESLVGQNVAIDDSLSTQTSSCVVRGLIIGSGATLVEKDRERHDEIASFNQQALRELSIAFIFAAQKRGFSLKELHSLATPLTRAFLAMACRAVLQPAKLNEEITMDISSVPEILSGLIELRLLKTKRCREQNGEPCEPSSSDGFAELLAPIQEWAGTVLGKDLAKSLA